MHNISKSLNSFLSQRAEPSTASGIIPAFSELLTNYSENQRIMEKFLEKVKEVVSNYEQLKFDGVKQTQFFFGLDESGSMSGSRQATLDSINEQLQQINLANKEGQLGQTDVTLCKFSNDTVYSFKKKNPKKLSITLEDYKPQGMTALLDAIASLIEVAITGKEFYNKNNGILISVFTDGEENSSKYMNATILKQALKLLNDLPNVTIALLGPNGSNSDFDALLSGIDAGNSLKSKMATNLQKDASLGLFAAAATGYIGTRSMNETKSFSLYANQKTD